MKKVRKCFMFSRGEVAFFYLAPFLVFGLALLVLWGKVRSVEASQDVDGRTYAEILARLNAILGK